MRRNRVVLALATVLAGQPGVGVGAIHSRAGWPEVPAIYIERRGRGRDPKPMSQNKRRQRAKWSR